MRYINRKKQLLKNTIIISIGTLSSKIFTFLLLPLYTTYLSTTDYGNVDILQIMITLLVPIITLELGSAVFRLIIEKNSLAEVKEIISSSFVMVTINITIFCFILLIINNHYNIEYFILFLFGFVTSAIYLIFQNIIRGFGDNILYSICNFLLIFISLLTNIILILVYNFKGESILIALVSSNTIVIIFIFLKEKLWKYISIKYFKLNIVKELICYSLPLIPNSISWWIVNVSDRIFIFYFLGSANNGIYAAANKIPVIYTTLYNIFNLAWTESVSRSCNDNDKEKFINEILEKSYKFFGCLCLGIICCISLCFDYIIGENYMESYIHIYILMIAIFINSLCAMYGGILTGYKKTKIIGFTTFFGAIINIIINLFFIKFIGLYAATISTLISYLIIMIIRGYEVSKLLIISFPINYFFRTFFITLIVTYGYFIKNSKYNLLILIMLIMWSYYENKDIFINLIEEVKKKLYGGIKK